MLSTGLPPTSRPALPLFVLLLVAVSFPACRSGEDSNFEIHHSNLVAEISTISPPYAIAGQNGFTMVVKGSNFLSDSVVHWNGTRRPTRLISTLFAYQLEAAISAGDVASPGTASITVWNPSPGGGISNPRSVSIYDSVLFNPVPSIVSLSPDHAPAGTEVNLTIYGSNFVPGCQVIWASPVSLLGAYLTPSSASPSQLTVVIPSGLLPPDGWASVTVINPLPGGGESNTLFFTIE